MESQLLALQQSEHLQQRNYFLQKCLDYVSTICAEFERVENKINPGVKGKFVKNSLYEMVSEGEPESYDLLFLKLESNFEYLDNMLTDYQQKTGEKIKLGDFTSYKWVCGFLRSQK